MILNPFHAILFFLYPLQWGGTNLLEFDTYLKLWIRKLTLATKSRKGLGKHLYILQHFQLIELRPTGLLNLLLFINQSVKLKSTFYEISRCTYFQAPNKIPLNFPPRYYSQYVKTFQTMRCHINFLIMNMNMNLYFNTFRFYEYCCSMFCMLN